MKQWAARLALAAVSVLVAVGSLEFALRLRSDEAQGQVTERVDPILGRVKASGKGLVYRKRDAYNIYDTNSEGFYDRERAKEKPPGVFRIAVIGDSFIDAVQVPFESTLSQRLEKALSRPERPVEVLNFGRGGTSLPEYRLLLEHWALAYDPDLVLVFVYNENDLDDLRPDAIPQVNGKYVRPVYAWENGRLLLKDYSPPALEASHAAGKPRSALLHLVRERVWNHPRVVSWMVNAGLMDGSQLYSRGVLVNADGYPTLYNVYRVSPPDQAEWQYAFDLAGHILQDMASLCAEHGARFAVASIPSQFEVHGALRSELFHAYPAMAKEKWDFEQVSNRLEESLGRHAIPFLRLDRPLRSLALAAGDKPLYFKFNAHWNSVGNAAAASAVEDFIAQNGLAQGTAFAGASHQQGGPD